MKKIMFNDKYGLTIAVLEGRKTMTRRIVPEGTPFGNWEETLKKSHYQLGEVVAIAQNYNEVFDEFATIVYLQDKPTPDNFKAFGAESDETLPKTMPGWNNKMFVRASLMPHQIRITNIRAERLQDISDADCLREGIWEEDSGVSITVSGCEYAYPCFRFEGSDMFTSPREAFAALIDKVSGKGTWASKPWVFVYEFELVK